MSQKNKRTNTKPLNVVQKNQIKQMVGVKQEFKYFVQQIATLAVTNTASVTSLTDIPQGVTDSDRVGDRIRLDSLEFRGDVLIGDQYNFVRVIIFSWIPNSTPTAASILLPDPSTNPGYLSLYSHDNRQQYKIVWDRTFFVSGNGSSASQPFTSATSVCFQGKLTNFPKDVQFAGGTTTSTRKLYLLTVADSGILPHPSVNASFKTLYTDS